MEVLAVATTKETFEALDLASAAKRLGIPLVLCRIESVDDIPKPSELSLLYWRSGPLERLFPNRTARIAALRRLRAAGVLVVNKNIIDAPETVYKSVQQAVFCEHISSRSKLQPIPTYQCATTEEVSKLLAAGELAYPFIAKPDYGSRGNGISLVNSDAELASIATNLSSLVLQNYIPNDGDYRILVVGGVVHEVMYRQAAVSSEGVPFLNNLSQGGTATLVTDGALKRELSVAALKVAAIFGHTICGVDILRSHEGKLYFLEVNSVVQWSGLSTVTTTSVSEHIVQTLAAIANVSEVDLLLQVRNYYLMKLRYLPTSLRFHFLSRLHLWSGAQKYKDMIEAEKAAWWGTTATLVDKIKQLPTLPLERTELQSLAKVKKYRVHALCAHAKVRAYNKLLFKLLFDTTIFGGQEAAKLLPEFDLDDVRLVRDRLLADTQSVFELSTIAVNFLLLCDFFFAEKGMAIDLQYFVAVADAQRIDDERADVDARIYFYTHIIIGMSRFYSNQLSEPQRLFGIELLQRVEKVILDNFATVSLDHKCEFLVCAKICRYDSALQAAIWSEVKQSVSTHGPFLVNRLNSSSKKLYKDNMESMEHTNVLAIMAFLDQSAI